VKGRICLLLVCIFLLAINCFLALPVYSQSLDISLIGYGARGIALGKTQAALQNVGAVFANPAGLARVKNFSLTSLYTNLSEEVPYSMFGGAFPVKEGYYGCFGVGHLSIITSNIFITSSEVGSSPSSSTGYSGRMLSLSYANDVTSYLDFGFTVKIFTENFSSLQNSSAYGTSLDFGFLVYPKEKLAIGIMFQNFLFKQIVWATGTHEEAPMNVKMGINYEVRDDITCLFDYDSSYYIHSGIEFRPTKLLSIRGGLEGIPISANEMVVNNSFGVGLSFNGFNFDYAYATDSLLKMNSSHFFSLSFEVPQIIIEKAPSSFAEL